MKKEYVEPIMDIEEFGDELSCGWGGGQQSGEGQDGFWDDVEDI